MKNMSFEQFDVYFEEVADLSRNEMTLTIAELADDIAEGKDVVFNLQKIQLIIDLIAMNEDESLVIEPSNATYTPNTNFFDIPVN